MSTPHNRPVGSLKQTWQTWTHTRRLVILPSTSHRAARLNINKERRLQRHPRACTDISAMLYTTAQVHRLSECYGTLATIEQTNLNRLKGIKITQTCCVTMTFKVEIDIEKQVGKISKYLKLGGTFVNNPWNGGNMEDNWRREDAWHAEGEWKQHSKTQEEASTEGKSQQLEPCRNEGQQSCKHSP